MFCLRFVFNLALLENASSQFVNFVCKPYSFFAEREGEQVFAMVGRDRSAGRYFHL